MARKADKSTFYCNYSFVIINKGEFLVNLCYGRVCVPCLLVYPVEPIKVLGIYAFNKYLLRPGGEGMTFEKISRIPLER